MKNIIPTFLEKGDRIRIVAPAKKMPPGSLEYTEKWLTQLGFEVVFGNNVYAEFNGFAGSDEQRIADVQEAFDDEECKAILFARGGYGSVRILDRLNFDNFLKSPKWLAGFSDITFFHGHCNFSLNLCSLHSTVPLKIDGSQETQAASISLMNALQGIYPTYEIPTHPLNMVGETSGTLVGGNLAIFHGQLSSFESTQLEEKILFLEDVGEELYQIDRNLMNLERAGVFDNINGLIIGGFTSCKDTNKWFNNSTPESLIYERIKSRKIPVCFNFPAGHIDNNMTMFFGMEVFFRVEQSQIQLTYKSKNYG